jgi:hypothetical protein
VVHVTMVRGVGIGVPPGHRFVGVGDGPTPLMTMRRYERDTQKCGWATSPPRIVGRPLAMK